MKSINRKKLSYTNEVIYLRLSKSIEDKEVFRVLEWYETISETYDDLYRNEQRLKYFMLFKDIDSYSTNFSNELLKVIDIGCGTAELASYLDDRLGRYRQIFFIGLDLSPKQLSIAKRKSESLNIIIELIAADLTYPPLRGDVKVDIVALISVIKCWYDVHAILNYIRKNFVSTILLYTILCNSDDLLNKLIHELRSASCKRYSSREILCIEGDIGEGV